MLFQIAKTIFLAPKRCAFCFVFTFSHANFCLYCVLFFCNKNFFSLRIQSTNVDLAGGADALAFARGEVILFCLKQFCLGAYAISAVNQMVPLSDNKVYGFFGVRNIKFEKNTSAQIGKSNKIVWFLRRRTIILEI